MIHGVQQIGLRIAAALAVVVAVTFTVFLLIHLVPGDPIAVMLGEFASGADQNALRIRLGLDRPLATQWIAFVSGVARLDLGFSLYNEAPVLTLVAKHFAMTVELAVTALAFSVVFGLPLGVLAALRVGGGIDKVAALLAVLGMSLPSFVLGPLLMLVFAVWLGWFPIGGSVGPGAVILPAATLGLALCALLARMTGAALLDVLDQPFIRAARARGLTETRVVFAHALRNALPPIVTILGLQFGGLLGGAVVTEVVFGWPGLGHLVVESIQRRDYPVVQGGVLIISLSYVAVNVLSDVICIALDPRVLRE